MKKNITKYLSKTAQNINPYQWEEGVMQKSLRFDTNTLPSPPPSLKFFLKKMADNCSINEYTDPSYAKLKRLIADYESVEQDMITVTNSGDEAIDILAKTFLNPGDYFVVTPPTYGMFTIQCEINNGKSLEIPLVGKMFKLDAEKIIQASRDPKVKIIFLVNPNNPTATVIPGKTIEKIVKNSYAIVAVDEVYREFYGKSSLWLLKECRNLVILRSFSKFAAMAGARVGYLIANKLLSQKFDSIRFPMGVSLLSYKLAEIVLEKDQKWIKKQIEMIKNERKRLSCELSKFGFYVFPSQANFLLVKIGNKAGEYCRKLKEKGAVIRDRSKKKYLQGCVRITVRSPKENNQLLNKFKEVLYEARD